MYKNILYYLQDLECDWKLEIYTMEYYLAIKKEETFILCNSMDGPGEHYAN